MLRNKSSQKSINRAQTLIAIAIQLALFGGMVLSFAVFHTATIFIAAVVVAIAVVVWGALASPERWS